MKHRMTWIKWTMMSAAGLLPAMALADEAPKPNPAPQEIRVKFLDARDNQPRVIVVADGNEKPGEPKPHPQLPLGADPQRAQQQLQNAQHELEWMLNGVKREKGTYLGVSAAAPPAVLRKQLGLAPGMGLVVEFVVPDSPAAKAGVQQYDVLQKLEDQWLVNREQLTVLVRFHKPGDDVKLGIIRDGKPVTLTAKLIEHDVEPLDAAEGEFAVQFDRIVPAPQITLIAPGQRPPGSGWAGFNGKLNTSSMTWLEGDRSYSIVTNHEGHKTFTVKGKDGKIVFEGPVDSNEDRDKIPADLKRRFEQLQKDLIGGLNPYPYGATGGKAATQPVNKKNADGK